MFSFFGGFSDKMNLISLIKLPEPEMENSL